MGSSTYNAYHPRAQFTAFHARQQRWAVLLAHRRAGKTFACVNDMVMRAVYTLKPDAQYAYLAPFRDQAKRVAWNYLLKATQAFSLKINIAELSVIIRTQVGGVAKLMLFGADNADAIRGIYLDGVVIDEPAQIREGVFTEVLRPLLADRRGWAIFIGTPQGRNEFYRIWTVAARDPSNWFTLRLPVSETKLLDANELADIQRIMDPDEYEQEFECSFDAAIKGSYYGRLINSMGHRLGKVDYDPALPVHISLDLGFSDTTAVWFWQTLGTETHYVDCYERAGLAISDHIEILHSKGYVYGKIWLPPDAKARTLQTGMSLVEILHRQHGVRPQLIRALSVQQGIQAARLVLQECWIDAERCAEGVEALRQYQREYDPEIRAFKQNPKHDAASNFADSFRYSALAIHPSAGEKANRLVTGDSKPAYDPSKPFGGHVRLQDIWDTAERVQESHRI